MSTIKINDFYTELKLVGLKSNSKSWQDYEKGKKFIQDNKPAIHYNHYIRQLVDYLGL